MNSSKWRTITWTEYCKWVQGKQLKEEIPMDGEVALIFADRWEARIQSTYYKHKGYSEYTPGWTEATLPTIRIRYLEE
jgi:hypothetical protein